MVSTVVIGRISNALSSHQHNHGEGSRDMSATRDDKADDGDFDFNTNCTSQDAATGTGKRPGLMLVRVTAALHANTLPSSLAVSPRVKKEGDTVKPEARLTQTGTRSTYLHGWPQGDYPNAVHHHANVGVAIMSRGLWGHIIAV